MHQKDADGMENSVDPDRDQEKADLGQHCSGLAARIFRIFLWYCKLFG